jgi:hypothetical protein
VGLPYNNFVACLLRAPSAYGDGETAIGIGPLGSTGGALPPLTEYFCEPRLPASFSGACFAQLSGGCGAWLLLHSLGGVAVVELPPPPPGAVGGGGGGGVGGAVFGGSLLGGLAGLPAPPLSAADIGAPARPRRLRAALVAPELLALGAFPASDVRWHPWSAPHFVALSRDGLRIFDSVALLGGGSGGGGVRVRPMGLVGELLFPPRALRAAPVSLAWGAEARLDARFPPEEARAWKEAGGGAHADWAAVAGVITCLDGSVYVACPLLAPLARLPLPAAALLLEDAGGWEAAAAAAGSEAGAARARRAAHALRRCLLPEGSAAVWDPRRDAEAPLLPALQGPVELAPRGASRLFDGVLSRGAFACDATVLPSLAGAAALALAVLGADGRLALLVAPTPIAPAWCASTARGAGGEEDALPGSGVTGVVPLGGDGEARWGEQGWGGSPAHGGGGGGGGAFSPHPPWCAAAALHLRLGSPVEWAAHRTSCPSSRASRGLQMASFAGGVAGEGAFGPEVLQVPRLTSGGAVPPHGVVVVGARSAHFVSLAVRTAVAALELRRAADAPAAAALPPLRLPPLNPVPLFLAARDVVGACAWGAFSPAGGSGGGGGGGADARAPLLLWSVPVGGEAGVGAGGAARASHPAEALALLPLQSAAVSSQVAAAPRGGAEGAGEGAPVDCGELRRRGGGGAPICALDALPVPTRLEPLELVNGEAHALLAEHSAGAPALDHKADQALAQMRAWRDLAGNALSHAETCRALAEYGSATAEKLRVAVGALHHRVRGGGGGGGGGGGVEFPSLLARKEAAARKLAELKNRLLTVHFLLALRRAEEEDRRRAGAGGGPPPRAAGAPAPRLPDAATFKEERAFEQLRALRDAVKRETRDTLGKAAAAKGVWEGTREAAPADAGADAEVEAVVARMREQLADAKRLRERAAATFFGHQHHNQHRSPSAL